MMTVALDAESLPWGGVKGKAQSERAKRDPRQSGKSAEMIALNDLGKATPPDRPKRRLGSASKIAEA